MAELYDQLAAEFDHHYTRDGGGGTKLTYVTGEQVTTRLNEVLGFDAWTFRILEHGIHEEADECWALGELIVIQGDRAVTRQQFGSQKIKRPAPVCAVCGGKANQYHDKDQRANPHTAEPIISPPLDIGFDLKGAATDAMKKCASLIGVGLYLSEKDGGVPNDAEPQPPRQQPARAAAPHLSVVQSSASQPMPEAAAIPPKQANTGFQCEECGADLAEVRFKDGTAWSAEQLGGFGRRKHGKVLCITHYKAANEARRATVLSQLGAN